MSRYSSRLAIGNHKHNLTIFYNTCGLFVAVFILGSQVDAAANPRSVNPQSDFTTSTGGDSGV